MAPGGEENGRDAPARPAISSPPWSTHAQASLREILSVMSTRVVDEAFVTLPLRGRAPDPEAYVGDPAVASALRAGLAALATAASGPPAG